VTNPAVPTIKEPESCNESRAFSFLPFNSQQNIKRRRFD
jgi:hypothetical protein